MLLLCGVYACACGCLWLGAHMQKSERHQVSSSVFLHLVLLIRVFTNLRARLVASRLQWSCFCLSKILGPQASGSFPALTRMLGSWTQVRMLVQTELSPRAISVIWRTVSFHMKLVKSAMNSALHLQAWISELHGIKWPFNFGTPVKSDQGLTLMKALGPLSPSITCLFTVTSSEF